MPRTMASTFTPAFEASYSASISVSSTSEFILIQIAAGLPSFAKAISWRISASKVGRVVSGEKASFSIVSGRA